MSYWEHRKPVRRLRAVDIGEVARASVKLLEAAQMLARQPEAMQLRYLQTLTQIAGDKSSTIVFPLPMGVLSALAGGGSK